MRPGPNGVTVRKHPRPARAQASPARCPPAVPHPGVVPLRDPRRALGPITAVVGDEVGDGIEAAVGLRVVPRRLVPPGSPRSSAGTDGAVVYAEGHTPPPRSPEPNLSPTGPWMLARVGTEQTWGGDDFADTYTTADLPRVLGDRGIQVVLELDCFDPAAEMPANLWGRSDPICGLQTITLQPA